MSKQKQTPLTAGDKFKYELMTQDLGQVICRHKLTTGVLVAITPSQDGMMVVATHWDNTTAPQEVKDKVAEIALRAHAELTKWLEEFPDV